MDGLTLIQTTGLLAAFFAVGATAHFLDKRFPLADLVNRLMRRIRRPKETLHGYENPEVVQVVFQKTVAFRPEGLLWADILGAATVLDYGGGCGLHYKQARSSAVRWAVVETPAMVARAKELATDRLQFFTDISEAAAWLGDIDVMHSNGAIHFADDPEQITKQLCSVGAKKLVWDRMHLSDAGIQTGVQTSNLVDNGPGRAPACVTNKAVEYGYTKIPEQTFLDAHAGYDLVKRGTDWFRFSLR
jgi:putative methyltransferase (TIGR04325 family)